MAFKDLPPFRGYCGADTPLGAYTVLMGVFGAGAAAGELRAQARRLEASTEGLGEAAH